MVVAPLVLALVVAGGARAWADKADPDARARATVARMTRDERYQLLRSFFVYPPRFAVADHVPAMGGYIAPLPRLGLPAIRETDGSLGVANMGDSRPGDQATALPSGLALAASFNPDLALAAGTMIGAEARAKGFNVLLAGGVNLARDPRAGRNFEALGEDPLAVGLMAGAEIAGIQSQHVVSTIKHFVLNDQETARHTYNAIASPETMRESDLLAFEIALERGRPGAVMCGYNRVNGPWACGSHALLEGVLRHDWGFKGWVMSDWGAVQSADYAGAGLDQESGAQLDHQPWFGAPLQARVAQGAIPAARIAQMDQRILRSLYAVGADAPASGRAIDQQAHDRTARAIAGQGIVLLRNAGSILPLRNREGRLLVIGGYADTGVLSGGGSSQVMPVGGAAASVPMGGAGFIAATSRQIVVPSSPLAALRASFAHVAFDSGYDPVQAALAAAQADTVILFATKWSVESLDSGSLALPQGQDALIEAVAAANPHVIVVLETGNPVAMPWLDKVAAVLEAWYPGQKGGEAIADVLSGAINPSGRLPMTFPADVSQLPRPRLPGLGAAEQDSVDINYDREGSDVGYRWFARHRLRPLFAFGHGLSYTHFDYSDLNVAKGRPLRASFTVRNDGALAGADVPQLYLTCAAGRPLFRLAAFSRLSLAPGAQQRVTVDIDPRLLASWHDGRWRRAGGAYCFALGHSAMEMSGERAEVILPEMAWGYARPRNRP